MIDADEDTMMDEDTLRQRAIEAAYFTKDRGWSLEAVAELLRVPIGHVRYLLLVRSGASAAFIPSPDEIAAGMNHYRPTKQGGLESPTASPAAILEQVIEYRPDPRDESDEAA